MDSSETLNKYKQFIKFGTFEHSNKNIYRFTQNERDSIVTDCIDKIRMKVTLKKFLKLKNSINEYIENSPDHKLALNINRFNADIQVVKIITTWLNDTFCAVTRPIGNDHISFKEDTDHYSIQLELSEELANVKKKGLRDPDIISSPEYKVMLLEYLEALILSSPREPYIKYELVQYPVFGSCIGKATNDNRGFYTYNEYKIKLLSNQMP